MAGTNSNFSATAFRDAIQFAMQMGAPTDETLRVTFCKPSTLDTTGTDSSSNPWDWNPPQDVVESFDQLVVDCAVSFDTEESGINLGSGRMQQKNAVITVLDEQYDELVAEFDNLNSSEMYVTINGQAYDFMYEAPPVGLFDVTVHQFVVKSRDLA